MSQEGTSLSTQISFQAYLKSENYERFSDTLFMREDPFQKEPVELIGLRKVKGVTNYVNFQNKKDRGTILDFLRNRSLEEGRVIPNKDIDAFLNAVIKAKYFIKNNPEKTPEKATYLRKEDLISYFIIDTKPSQDTLQKMEFSTNSLFEVFLKFRELQERKGLRENEFRLYRTSDHSTGKPLELVDKLGQPFDPERTKLLATGTCQESEFLDIKYHKAYQKFEHFITSRSISNTESVKKGI